MLLDILEQLHSSFMRYDCQLQQFLSVEFQFFNGDTQKGRRLLVAMM
jgi:hypothetical protein